MRRDPSRSLKFCRMEQWSTRRLRKGAASSFQTSLADVRRRHHGKSAAWKLREWSCRMKVSVVVGGAHSALTSPHASCCCWWLDSSGTKDFPNGEKSSSSAAPRHVPVPQPLDSKPTCSSFLFLHLLTPHLATVKGWSLGLRSHHGRVEVESRGGLIPRCARYRKVGLTHYRSPTVVAAATSCPSWRQPRICSCTP